MFGRRRSTAAVLERDLSEAGSRAAETVAELAERALTAAREAGQYATPAIRTATQHSVEGLSHAAERAAEVLSDTAERLAQNPEIHPSEVTRAARERLADASEKLAKAVRPAPKPQRHRMRRALIGIAIIGGIAALVRSPLRTKVTDRLFGPPPEDEPGSITLPYRDEGQSGAEDIEIPPDTAQTAASSVEANGVKSPAAQPDTTRG